MPRPAIAGYTEKFETWQASSNTTWQTKDLSVAPFNVPANAVVEIAVTNLKANQARTAGVRAFGSSLERKLDLHEAEGGGTDVLVMHVQTDASSRIEHYAEGATDLDFYLLGYWDSGTYVEKISAFTAGADATWTDVNLNTYGVSASEIAEIALLNNQASGAREAGVRTNGSLLARLVDIHEAEGTTGGVDALSMLVAADGTANATIEAYAETDADVDFYLLGYWTTAPDTYTEMFVDMGSPSADATWEDKDLSGGSFNLPADVVAEIALGNQFATEENNMGVRTNGSSLARLFNLDEAEGAAGADGADLARPSVLVDQSAKIEFYHQDVSDTHQFTLLGYWGPTSGVRLSDHAAGQETDAFTETGSETDAELFGFRIQNLDGDTSSITQLVFRISNITGLVDGDWAGVELVEDTNGDGTISGGETTTVGGAGTVSTAGGTITFSTSFNVSSAINYILRADFASLSVDDEVDIALSASDITTADSVTGSTDSVDHKEVGGDCLGYVEVFQTWSASAAAIWEEKDLSGAPYNVPPHAVVEIAAYNTGSADYDAGMRATGSSVERRLKISRANADGSWRALTMHVQADGNGKIEQYAEDTSNIGFALLGYWTCGVYVEKFDTFTAGASNSWQDKNLNTYGVGASQFVEMVLEGDDNTVNHIAGVRANGSSLNRSFDIAKPSNAGGKMPVSAMVQADATANATIEVYAQLDSAIDFYVAGYWSLAPGTYIEKLVNVGGPSMSATWEDLDLTGIVSADAVAQFAVGNAEKNNNNQAGVRKN
ncbi:MAG: hypothetical protein IID37_06345 [Planctomycetes bacterium]|nr:hypothetical protein [Planctomycetota bacterium]